MGVPPASNEPPRSRVIERPRPMCEPRVEPPRATQQRRKLKRSNDPLEALGLKAFRTKEQIDALEKMLQCSMPPRVVLENAFAGLRHAAAEDLETAMEVQYQRGVKQGEMQFGAFVEDVDLTHLIESDMDLEQLTHELNALVDS